LPGTALPPRYLRVTPDGRWLQLDNRTLPDGTRVRTHTDVTAQCLSEQALRAANQRLATIVDGTRAGTWEWDLVTNEVVLNERFASLVGHALHELPRDVYALYDLLLHPDDEERLAQANQAHLRARRSITNASFASATGKGIGCG